MTLSRQKDGKTGRQRSRRFQQEDGKTGSLREILAGPEVWRELRGLFFQQQCTIPVRYKRHEPECGYRADFIVASRIVIELKSVDRLSPVHQAQLLTYLK